jgi:hypothetical protein
MRTARARSYGGYWKSGYDPMDTSWKKILGEKFGSRNG